MAKKKQKKAKPPRQTGRLRGWWRGLEADRRAAVRRGAAWTLLALLLLAGGAFGLKVLEAQVLTAVRTRPPVEARMELVGAPAWMPAGLKRHLRERLAPRRGEFFDEDLSCRLYDRAAALPWVRGVQRVQKGLTDDPDRGLIRLWARYRQPFAVVRRGTDCRFVDREGFVVPEAFVPRWRLADAKAPRTFVHAAEALPDARLQRVHYILIDGAAAEPPPAGRRWDGADVQVGLRLVEWIRGAPYWREVTVVDVHNHDHRRDRQFGGPLRPELLLKAQRARSGLTTIVFGSFPRPGGDYVVPPATKRAYLDAFVRRHGKLAGVKDTIYLVYDQLRTEPAE